MSRLICCAFCDKPRAEVRALIARRDVEQGPTICDECLIGSLDRIIGSVPRLDRIDVTVGFADKTEPSTRSGPSVATADDEPKLPLTGHKLGVEFGRHRTAEPLVDGTGKVVGFALRAAPDPLTMTLPELQREVLQLRERILLVRELSPPSPKRPLPPPPRNPGEPKDFG